MADDYISSDGEQVQAMRLDPELVTVLSVWCHGNIVEEIDPFSGEKFPAINLRTQHDTVSRANLGDYVIKHEDGSFEVRKPGAFLQHYSSD
jgi:hypothetical protein